MWLAVAGNLRPSTFRLNSMQIDDNSAAYDMEASLSGSDKHNMTQMMVTGSGADFMMVFAVSLLN